MRFAPFAALLWVACSWDKPDSTRAIPSGPLALHANAEIRDLQRYVHGWWLRLTHRSDWGPPDTLRVEVENGSERPIFVYREPQRYLEQAIEFRSHPVTAGHFGHCRWHLPQSIRIPPRTATSWTVMLASNLPTPRTIHLGWSDQPLVTDKNGCTQAKEFRDELIALERGTLTAPIK